MPLAQSRTAPKTRLGCESLEPRDMPSVWGVSHGGGLLYIWADHNPTDVEVRYSENGSGITVEERGTGRRWDYGWSAFSEVVFYGGGGNDRFTNSTFTRSTAYGGYGDDVLLGGRGNDLLDGGDGNDRVNGRGGTDTLRGGNHDDVLIAIDNGTADTADPGAGRDVIWIDRNLTWKPGAVSVADDAVVNADAGDATQRVRFFANGADRTLDNDRIADPATTNGYGYTRFDNRPLFPTAGPSINDPRQGNLDGCWVLAGFGAVARDSPQLLRQRIVDFDDGTYGVRLGDSFYRVDNDLPTYSPQMPGLVYSKFGADGSMWVAIAEKAYAHYRDGTNSYASLNHGPIIHVLSAFGATSVGGRDFPNYTNATELGFDIYARWAQGESIGLGTGVLKAAGLDGGTLVDHHVYTVVGVALVPRYQWFGSYLMITGWTTYITLRNPWGYDGGGSNDGNFWDGLVTVTADQLFNRTGGFGWGTLPRV